MSRVGLESFNGDWRNVVHGFWTPWLTWASWSAANTALGHASETVMDEIGLFGSLNEQ